MIWAIEAAWAEEPPADEPEVIVVEDRRTPAAAWDAVQGAVRDLGYGRGLDLGERIVYLPPVRDLSKPFVTVREDGTFRAMSLAATPIPVLVPGWIGVVGYGGSKSQERALEARVADALWAPMADYRAAIAAEAMDLRLDALRDTMFQVWRQGIAPDGTARSRPDTKRACLASMWLRTTDSPEGARVRREVARFVDEVVMAEAPYTAAEIVAINARRAFDEPFTPRDGAR